MKTFYLQFITTSIAFGCILFASFDTTDNPSRRRAGKHAVTLSAREQPLQLVTVCEVLKNRNLYNGKMVAILGHWSATDEGAWVVGDCSHHLKTGAHLWSDSIWLEYDSSSESAFKDHMPMDMVAAKRKLRELKRDTKPCSTNYKWAVVYGRFETYEELRTSIAGDGNTTHPAGFGHLNDSPAQIVHKSKDVLFISSS